MFWQKDTANDSVNLTTKSRYTTIVVSIALFLVFDLGVLVLNFYVASAIKADAVAVNLAGRQRMLSQRTVKTLLQLDSDLLNERSIDRSLKELRTTIGLFDSTLFAFRDGNTVTGADGKPIFIPAAETAAGKAAVSEGIIIWDTYQDLINKAIPDGEQISEENLSKAIAYANNNNLRLLKLMNDLTIDLEGVAAQKAETLRFIQATGITLALINFGIILFHFIGNLRRSDDRAKKYADDLENTNNALATTTSQLAAAKEQTDQIMETVNEGLFLLEGDGRIDDQYSRELDRMFPGKPLANIQLLELLAPMVDGKTWEMTRDFLPLVFQGRIKEKMLLNVNPLEQVEVHTSGSDAGPSKILSFSFNRIPNEDGVIERVLVTVRDITTRIRLEEELANSKAKAKEQADLMFGILHIDPQRLREFLEQTDQRLNSINQQLRQSETGSGNLKKLVGDIFREIHAVKGDAGLLGLDLFEETVHAFEDKLNEMRDRPNLSGPDFVGLTIDLNDLRRLRQETMELVERIAGLNKTFDLGSSSGTAQSGLSQLVPELNDLIAQLGENLNKSADLNGASFDPGMLSQHDATELRDIVIQLVKNSLAHGIEPPAERKSQGKQPRGRLSLSTHRDGNDILLTLRDDGRGLQLDKIRQRAIEQQLISSQQAQQMNSSELAALIFKPGFSTAESADTSAGRGVGMDIVRERIAALGGKLRLSYSQGQFSEFVIRLPVSDSADDLSEQAA